MKKPTKKSGYKEIDFEENTSGLISLDDPDYCNDECDNFKDV